VKDVRIEEDDEVVAREVDVVHVEKMDATHVWMALYDTNARRLIVNFTSRAKITIDTHWE